MIRIILATLLLWSGIGAASAQDVPWSQVSAIAAKGGVINIYHNIPPPGADQWLAGFHDAFPSVTVEATRLGSGEMQHRVTTEMSNGVYQADVIMTLWDDTVAKWVADGWVRAWTPPESSMMPANTIYRNSVYTFSGARAVIISNTAKVRAADAPKEWEDIFDPKWKGAVGMDPPWRSVIVQATNAFWEDIGIKDVARRLKANDVRFFNGSAGVLQAVIRGDIKVAPTIEGPVIGALADGAPVRVTFPKSGIPAVASTVMVPTKSPNPELGMLFANWVLSAAGQQSYQDIVGPPAVRPGLKPPRFVPPNDAVKVIWSTTLLTPERQKANIEEFRDVFGVK